MLAPYGQGRILPVARDVAMPLRHSKCLQSLKTLVPCGAVAIPYEADAAKELLAVVTQSGVAAQLLEFVLVSLPEERTLAEFPKKKQGLIDEIWIASYVR